MFDRVPYGNLNLKLQKIGLTCFIVRWMMGYLRNRKQIFDNGSNHLEPLGVRSGVSQSSVLAILLFLVYINDIVSVVQQDAYIRLFTNDCVIFREINEPFKQFFLVIALRRLLSGAHCEECSRTMINQLCHG